MDPNQFKNPSGSYYLLGLFYEQTTTANRDSVLYTLKDYDLGEYKSLYRLYIQECLKDPTEYTFANKYLDGLAHWKRLCECTWFQDYVSRWRAEIELAIRSKALTNIIKEAQSPSKNSFIANKFLLEGNWKQDRKAGRPTKDDIRKEAFEQVAAARQISEDAERIFNIPEQLRN